MDAGLFGSGLSGGGFDPTALGGIPETDPGINVAGSASWLDSLTKFAGVAGQSINGILNTINYGNAQQWNQQNAVALARPAMSFGTIAIFGLAAYLLFRKK